MKNHLTVPLAALCCLLSLLTTAANGQAINADISPGLYGQTIVIHDSKMQPIADELADVLKQITGKKFKITNTPTPAAIALATADQVDGFEVLAGQDAEAFVIRSDGGDRLTIVGNTLRGLRHGVYAYLETLGVRWYLPTENWTVIPELTGITIKVDELRAPVFAQRGFAGTGGFGGNLPLDLTRQLQETWGAWQRHLKFDGRVAVSGHYGEAFNLKHKDVLTANPQMVAEVDGKRTFGHITKLCNSNAKLVELYVKDRVEAYGVQLERDPEAPRSFAVSVEPADGGGHCECDGCKKLGTISDAVFTLVNAAARGVAEKYPDGHVSLFAYNEHALPPKFDVEDNVLVIVTPYAFQRTGLPADKLLEVWSEKAQTFGLYDYWSIPDWSNDLPSFKIDRGVKRVQRWHELGAIGALFESTYSGGAIGPVMYITSKLYWDIDADPDAILDEFCNGAFGDAAPPMRRMFDRWFSDFLLSEHELGLSYLDVMEADALAKDDAVKRRVDDYKRYIQYLRMWYEYKQSGPDERHAKTDELITYCWRIYDSGMIHAYRMAQLLSYRYEGKDLSHREKWDPYKGTADWKSIKPVEREELNAMIAEGSGRYKPLGYEDRAYSDDLVPISKKTANTDAWVTLPRLGGTATFKFYPPANAKRVPIRFTFGQIGSRTPSSAVRIFDPQGNIIMDEQVPTDKAAHTLNIPVQSQGCYSIEVYDQKSGYLVEVPEALPFVITEGLMSSDLSPWMYFYVPKGLKQIAFYCPGVIPVEVRDGAENMIPGEWQNFVVIDVPPGQDGTVWSIRKFKSWTTLKLLNVPNAVSFARDSLLVPRELAKSGG